MSLIHETKIAVFSSLSIHSHPPCEDSLIYHHAKVNMTKIASAIDKSSWGLLRKPCECHRLRWELVNCTHLYSTIILNTFRANVIFCTTFKYKLWIEFSRDGPWMHLTATYRSVTVVLLPYGRTRWIGVDVTLQWHFNSFPKRIPKARCSGNCKWWCIWWMELRKISSYSQ